MKVLLFCINCLLGLACCSVTKAVSAKTCKAGYKLMIDNCVLDVTCPAAKKYGKGPPETCSKPADPNRKPKSNLEAWFTKEVFEDLFPKANLGWGPNSCRPYSYEAFAIAARYFPRFGTESPNNGYNSKENYRRDLAAFLAHAIQESGENDNSLYNHFKSGAEASACFYRGGLYNWFEGGPTSRFLPPSNPGHDPIDGTKCNENGSYCISSPQLNYWFPCNKKTDGSYRLGCYFGRGPLQMSDNFNYGQFQQWLRDNGINVNLLTQPNLVMTHMNPPLAIMAALWFYMTPQPPYPTMHDIIMGNWYPGSNNTASGFKGPIFGPTSLVIMEECHGEDPTDPGDPGESMRIKAFKWFCGYFGIPIGAENQLTCKGMPQKLSAISQLQSWQPDWSTAWQAASCKCVAAWWRASLIPYYPKKFYPEEFVSQNAKNEEKCVKSIYDNPKMYFMDKAWAVCLNYPR